MALRQTKPFNPISNPRKGYCLANVRQSFGIGPLAATAKEAWDKATKKHADSNFPAGVVVPIFWAHKGGAGHVAVSLGDGRILSDYNANGTQVWRVVAITYCENFLGWTEDLNGVDVVTAIAEAQPAPAPAQDLNAIADEVLNGKWGNGADRVANLTSAGYDYTAVQALVNAKLNTGAVQSANKSVDELAREVIDGKWGNGQDRKNRLAAAGYGYAAVQARVNQLV